MIVLGIVPMAVIFFATGAIPIGVTGILMPLLAYMFKLLPFRFVGKTFAGDAPMFMLGVFALGISVTQTGFHKRLAVWIMGWTKDDTVFGHTDRFNPATQPDYRVETAPVAVPLPTTGGALPAEAASLGLVIFGAVSLTAGVASYAWRRRNLRKAA